MKLCRILLTGSLATGMGLSVMPLLAQDDLFAPPTPPAASSSASLAEEAAPPSPEEREALIEEARKELMAEIDKIRWEKEGVGKVGAWGEIVVPPGYRFTDGHGARQLLRLYGNLTGDLEQGIIAPENMDWFVTFDFFDVGYVKDDEKDQLDADKLMESMIANQQLSNEERRKQGFPQLFNEGWVVKPHYDETTNNLEYGFKLRSDRGGESINYVVKLLGRKGVMEAALVCGPDELDTALPKARQLLAGYRFVSGETYAEYRKGDKIAEFGLTALVLGGGAALAAKSGLFAVMAKFFGKFFKVILIGLVAIGTVFKKVFGGLLGSSQKPNDSLPPPPAPPPPPPAA